MTCTSKISKSSHQNQKISLKTQINLFWNTRVSCGTFIFAKYSPNPVDCFLLSYFWSEGQLDFKQISKLFFPGLARNLFSCWSFVAEAKLILYWKWSSLETGYKEYLTHLRWLRLALAQLLHFHFLLTKINQREEKEASTVTDMNKTG